MKDFKKKKFYNKKLFSIPYFLIPALLFFPLFPILYALSPILAQENTLTLDIVVTNPSDEESQEVEVKTDLPEELKEEDVVSSDGLEVGFDTEKGFLFVAGKVTLQPAETTIYKIVVRDVWVIPESEGAPVGDIGAHIAAYRENKKEISAVRSVINVMRETQERKVHNARHKALIGILTVLFGVIAYVIVRKKEVRVCLRNKLKRLGFGERRRYARLPNQAEVEYRLLPMGESGPVIPNRDISGGGISLSLDRNYSPQSVLELKVKLPPYAETLNFRGFIVWQKRITPHGRKEYYLTGISFGEVEKKEDYEKLKEFIRQRRRKLSRLIKRSRD